MDEQQQEIEDLTCLDERQGDAKHEGVEYRWVGEKAWPRCAPCHRRRLDKRERSVERYASSVSAPAWFDSSLAGESW